MYADGATDVVFPSHYLFVVCKPCRCRTVKNVRDLPGLRFMQKKFFFSLITMKSLKAALIKALSSKDALKCFILIRVIIITL